MGSIGDQQWRIDGQQLALTPLTLIDQGIRVGETALALVKVQENGSLTALAILGQPTNEPALSAQPQSGSPEHPTAVQPGNELEFFGRVERIDSGSWQVGGIALKIGKETEIKDRINLGDLVKVHAVQQQDGIFLAREIELAEEDTDPDEAGATVPAPTSPTQDQDDEPDDEGQEPERVKFIGVVQSIGAQSWVVDGMQVLISGETEIKDDPGVGDQVEVEAIRNSAGQLIAKKIVLKDD